VKGRELLRKDAASPATPVVVAIEVDDAELGDRLAALLTGVAGLRLASPGETSDVTLTDTPIEADAASPDPVLTARETEVLTLLAEGASNKEIARRLDISVHTAKFHVGRILDKLDATGRTDAVAHAARLGVLHL
jgi:DNA-binding CsgD family transcriptional regulator